MHYTHHQQDSTKKKGFYIEDANGADEALGIERAGLDRGNDSSRNSNSNPISAVRTQILFAFGFVSISHPEHNRKHYHRPTLDLVEGQTMVTLCVKISVL